MKGKICVVTGATSGIGAATAKGLARLQATTIIIGRSRQKCDRIVNEIKKDTGNPFVRYYLADLSSKNEISKVADQLKEDYPNVDVLINNAGAKFVSRLESIDGYEMSFALNHLAYFTLTGLLINHLLKSMDGRIINVSSGSHGSCAAINFDDPQYRTDYDGKLAYAQSKLANILFTYELAGRLNGTRLAVNALAPGGVATNFARNNGIIPWLKHIVAHILARNLISAAEGAKTSVFLATFPKVKGVSGKYFAEQRVIQSSKASYDRDAAKRLWKLSLDLTGIADFP